MRVLREARSLLKMGHQVVIYAVSNDGREGYEERDGIIIKRIPRRDRRIFEALKRAFDKERQVLEFIRSIIKSFIKGLSIVFTPFLILYKWIYQAYYKLTLQGQQPSKFSRLIYQLILRPSRFFRAKVVRFVAGFILRPFRLLAARSGISVTTIIIKWMRKSVIIALRYFLIDPQYCRVTVMKALSERADVYHAHDLNTLHMAYEVAEATSAKLVYDSHELYLDRNPRYADYSRISNFRLRWREARLIKKADVVITASEFAAQRLRDLYGISKPIAILNCPEYQPRKDPLFLREKIKRETNRVIRDRSPIFLYLGRVTYDRGLEEMIRSAVYLANDVLVVIIGHGSNDYKGNLRELARDLGVEHRVLILNPVEPKEVPLCASGATIGAALIQNVSISYYHCSPNKLFEYIMGGIPVIASDFPDLKRIIKEYQIGIVVDEKDPCAIASAVNALLENVGKYKDMCENAMRAAKIFNWENESKKLFAIYKRLEEELARSRSRTMDQ